MSAPYKIGGLLRCCIEAIPEDPAPVEGTFIDCPYAPHEMSGVWFVNGAWQAAWIGVK